MITDIRAELCKTCIHTKVCGKGKNLVGDRFIFGNPVIFDNQKLWEDFKKHEAAGFPCNNYLSIERIKNV